MKLKKYMGTFNRKVNPSDADIAEDGNRFFSNQFGVIFKMEDNEISLGVDWGEELDPGDLGVIIGGLSNGKIMNVLVEAILSEIKNKEETAEGQEFALELFKESVQNTVMESNDTKSFYEEPLIHPIDCIHTQMNMYNPVDAAAQYNESDGHN